MSSKTQRTQPSSRKPPAQTTGSEPAALEPMASEAVITRDFSGCDSFNGRTDIWSGVGTDF
ncbi:MAG: hypothetical protein R2912_09580 [Eubacteriales bacterium]